MSEHTHHHDQHGHNAQHANPDDESLWTAAFWDERYAGSRAVWSGNPNPRLVEQVTGLTPGTALDVGCGEGADAVWLARQGWAVTGIDVSRVALDRSREHAVEAGVEVDWRQVDVIGGEALPAPYDLVSAQFLHPPARVFADVVRAGSAMTRVRETWTRCSIPGRGLLHREVNRPGKSGDFLG